MGGEGGGGVRARGTLGGEGAGGGEGGEDAGGVGMHWQPLNTRKCNP